MTLLETTHLGRCLSPGDRSGRELQAWRERLEVLRRLLTLLRAPRLLLRRRSRGRRLPRRRTAELLPQQRLDLGLGARFARKGPGERTLFLSPKCEQNTSTMTMMIVL